MKDSKIEWTDATWNPLAGCTRVSEGCDNCYAAGMALRIEGMALADLAAGKDPGKKRKYIGVAKRTASGRAAFNGTINLDRSALIDPLNWTRPRRIFVNSMSDLFHKHVPFEFVAEVFYVMHKAHWHTFQVLTKRPDRMVEFFATQVPPGGVYSNVWLGTSVENQAVADERIPHLLKVPAAVRFLSCEPLLGPINLRLPTRAYSFPKHIDRNGNAYGMPQGIHWVIAGGESGAGARPANPNWFRSLRDQCEQAGVRFFFKQWGEYAPVSPETPMPLSQTKRLRGIRNDGTLLAPADSISEATAWVWRAGKAAAGRMLDGCTWDDIPQGESDVRSTITSH